MNWGPGWRRGFASRSKRRSAVEKKLSRPKRSGKVAARIPAEQEARLMRFNRDTLQLSNTALVRLALDAFLKGKGY